jgi:hypothetical protein
MAGMTLDLFAGMPVSDFKAWFEQLLGGAPSG